MKYCLGEWLMEICVGDIAEMKKDHPCGEKHFEVMRTGADVRLRCKGCGRELMLDRLKAEKAIKRILKK